MSVFEEDRALAKTVQPQGERLFVHVLENDRKIGSIYVPGNASNKLDLVVVCVLSRGTQCKTKPWDIAPGDHLLVPRTCLLRYDGVLGRVGRNQNSEYAFIYEKDAIAAVDPGTVVTGNAQYSEGKTGEWHQ